jgi:hypothetical protein
MDGRVSPLDRRTTLVFEFAGREPINLLIPKKYAMDLANGILEQYREQSPKPT